MSQPGIQQWSREDKLKEVFIRASKKLPAEVGAVLLEMIQPAALATMVAVLIVWAGSHFFGVGEIADVVLLLVGVAALGGVAWEAGKELIDFGKLTLNASTEADLEQASTHLAKAVSLLGVQVVMALLLKRKPETFKTPYSKTPPMAPFSKMKPMPRTPGLFYRPKITFTKQRLAGRAGTNPMGDIVVGRDHYGSAASAAEQVRLAVYHEKVHQFLTPKLQIFREFRAYAKQSGYKKSFILRYLEEALAETVAQCRMYGFGKEYIMKGVTFPLGTQYEITVAQLGAEAKGILLGPITVGGMVYNVYQSLRTE